MASKDRGNAISTYLIHCFMIWYDIATNVANSFRSLSPPGLLSTGLDPKSIAINLSSIFLFLLPLFVYFYEKYWKEYLAVVIGLFALTYIIPPRGWLRPHEVSHFIDCANCP